ncbi:MAG TPA: sulfate adenylyltransferase [Thermoplasmata archaeon]|nr:sulfate adenylyltransferase [Thermoplasmata archaeon]
MIPPAHGGHLVHRLQSPGELARRESEAKDLLRISPHIDQVYDTEKIGLGAYSPLEGFQDAASVASVMSKGRLPSDVVWPMPIVLTPSGPANSSVVQRARPGDDIGLLDPAGRLFALFHLEEKAPFPRTEVARTIYATTDPNHPNVADLLLTGETALAGKVDLLRRLDLPTGPLELAPEETRAEFVRRGWTNVAGYQTRNVPHTAHEYLQRCTLERDDIDGLLVHPVLGRLKKGDYRPEVILEAYQALVRHYYPAGRVMLAALSITMRYGGPKASLFLAIVRKNYGCGSYIVGRDQAGVGSYYDPFACQRIFDEFPIGVQVLKFAETFYCRDCGGMASDRTCAHPAERRMNTSQTRIREALARGESLPSEIIRPEVAKVLSRGDVLITD